MFVAVIYSFRVFFVYFIVYSLINIRIMIVINIVSLKKRNLVAIKKMRGVFALVISFIFLSLAGLPPFLGFYPKWAVAAALMRDSIYLVGVVLILGSLINIYYYLNVFFNVRINSFFRSEFYGVDVALNIKTVSILFFSVVRIFALGLIYIFIYAMVLFNKS